MITSLTSLHQNVQSCFNGYERLQFTEDVFGMTSYMFIEQTRLIGVVSSLTY